MDIITGTNEDGDLVVIVPAKDFSLDYVLKNAVPKNVSGARLANSSKLPDIDLRAAWKDDGKDVVIDMDKAKSIAHDLRRFKRDEYFEPRLEIIRKDSMGIPLKSGESAASAKAENKAYKDSDDILQNDIDNSSESELLLIVKQLKG